MQMNISSQVAVQIGSQPLLENTVVEGFELRQNPAIRKWDRNTLMIEKKANSFMVPGQHLNSGKYCTKTYVVRFEKLECSLFVHGYDSEINRV